MRFSNVLILSVEAFSLAYAANQSNVVFILTDDQDLHMDSLEYMPRLKQYMIDKGTLYKEHFCTISLCCPSRVSLLTGKYAHNTNVTDVVPPYGGYPKFISQGLNENYLPIWLQAAGYKTYYAGKLMNYQTALNYNQPPAAGWTSSDFVVDPYTYQYLNGWWTRDGGSLVNYTGQYTTDVLANKSYAYLEEAHSTGDPFFLTIAPIAPHSEIISSVASYNSSDPLSNPASLNQTIGPPIPAEKYKNYFNDAIVPRTPDFNPDVPSGVSWVAQLPQLNDTVIEYNDEYYRDRLRALQSVDELVEGVVTRLDQMGILDNTYIIYSTDNGYHIGQHRLQPGKECPFETDINIPLIIRGPGVPEGETADLVTSHTDLAPTFFEMMGIPLRDDFDGTPIPFTEASIQAAQGTRQEQITAEMWGLVVFEGKYGSSGELGFNLDNTYKVARLYSKKFNLYYSVYCNNEHELYDLNADPYQMNNLFGSGNHSTSTLNNSTSATIEGYSVSKIIARMDALLMVLKTCQGKNCYKPWEVLHPQDNVHNLQEALNPEFDDFYAESFSSNAVSFSACVYGQLRQYEGSQTPLIYGQPWSEWR